jgi:hypothetical protein
MTNCGICLENIDNKTTLECGHTYHYNCIYKWNKKNNSCPMCRNKQLNIHNKFSKKYFINHSKDFNVDLECFDCNSNLKKCESCYSNYCLCKYNHNNFNGRNVFQSSDNISTCLKCLLERDQILKDSFINNEYYYENINFDDLDFIYDNYEIMEIYNKYYKNYNDTFENITEFYDYEDFKEYSKNILNK